MLARELIEGLGVADAVDAMMMTFQHRAHVIHLDSEPSEETSRGVLESLENLVPNAMGRMIPVVSLLKQMMPASC